MANPRQRRKQKSGTRPVSRRSRNTSSRSIIVNDPLLRAAWDHTKTVKQNFAALGLANDVNRDISSSGTRKKVMQWQEKKAAALDEIERVREEAKRRAEAENRLDMTPIEFGEEDIFGQLNSIFAKEAAEEAERDEYDKDEDNGLKFINLVEEESKMILQQKKQQQQHRIKPLKEDEREYMLRLTAKHGNDCTAMARDLKLNVMQHTPKQLEALLKRL